MWQVFADQAGLNSVVLVHLDASDEALARRSLYKLGKKDKNITPAELAQAVEKIKARNTGDSAKERGKLLRRREVGAGVGNYDISLDNTNMSAQETYLVLLEELCQKFIS
jgi:cytidylate kinase